MMHFPVIDLMQCWQLHDQWTDANPRKDRCGIDIEVELNGWYGALIEI